LGNDEVAANGICRAGSAESGAREPDFEYRGRYSYFLTFCTDQRRERFVDASVAEMVIDQILRAATRFEFAVLAYCLMPDHLHLLVHGTSDGADLRRFAKRVKQTSGQIHRRRFSEVLWQEGHYDRVVRPEEDLSGIARYIIENPLHAGLVSSPLHYPFVGSKWPLEDVLRRDDGSRASQNPAYAGCS
jgi:putative transposase